jgi:Cys-tRNA(Pro)/Cys-tRNA(Cys) deacylase
MVTNNVTRLLASRKIAFEAFETPAEKLGAIETAQLLQIDPLMVFKTIVVMREKAGKPILAVIPGPHEVNLKALAVFVNEKKLRLPTQKEAEQVTGLLAGGISPLALINKGFQVVIDASAQNFPQIHISGGQRGVNIRLGVSDLVKLTNARMAAIATQDPADQPS